MKRSLTKAERLKKKADFDRVFNTGERAKDGRSKLVFISNGRAYNRIAVCPVKKYGNSVARNRAKRVCREAFRNIKDRLITGHDLVFVLYPGTDTEPKRRREIEFLCKKAGIWLEPVDRDVRSFDRSPKLPEKIHG